MHSQRSYLVPCFLRRGLPCTCILRRVIPSAMRSQKCYVFIQQLVECILRRVKPSLKMFPQRVYISSSLHLKRDVSFVMHPQRVNIQFYASEKRCIVCNASLQKGYILYGVPLKRYILCHASLEKLNYYCTVINVNTSLNYCFHKSLCLILLISIQ